MMINIDPVMYIHQPIAVPWRNLMSHCVPCALILWKATDLEKIEKISSPLAASDTRDVIRQVLE